VRKVSVDSSELVPWELVKSESFAKLRVYEVVHEERRNPRDGRQHSFCVQRSRDWVTVIPVTVDNEIVLVRQFRPGTGDVTWEFPGGVVESGEPPLSAVVRELEEESGFKPGEVMKVATLRPNPALIGNAMHVFLAKGCSPEGTRNFDDSEDLDTWAATPAEVDRMVDEGTMDHALMVAAWLSARRRALV